MDAHSTILVLVYGKNPSVNVRGLGHREAAQSAGVPWKVINLEPMPDWYLRRMRHSGLAYKAGRLTGRIVSPFLLLFHIRRICTASTLIVLKAAPLWQSRLFRRLRAKVTLFDVDDPIWLPEMAGPTWCWKTFKLYDGLICDNELQAKELREFKIPILVVPGAVPHAKDRVTASCQSTHLRIVWIGSYTTFSYLYEIRSALQHALNCGANADFIFLGCTPKQADSLGLPPSLVKHKTFYAEHEVIEVLSEATVGLAPTKQDPLSHLRGVHKIRVYMANGVPCVASRASLVTSIIEEGVNGYVCDSLTDWAKALESFSDPTVARRLSAGALETASAIFQHESLVPQSIESFSRGLTHYGDSN